MKIIYESGEDYLERILMLTNEHGHVRAIDLATNMNYSKPSVSRAPKTARPT
ncbi:MAG: metal-dependent transcriptional regulator, partial [Candidatus Moranbacteria bacterium]|nr:metal-dependent transcriptional regulator [Candidatus Moranbacteria bacterium]